MQRILENLSRQHRDLVKSGMQLLAFLDEARLADETPEALRCLGTFSGLLRVHLRMEDESFYPYLLTSKNPAVRVLATRFLDERFDLQHRFDEFRQRFSSLDAIQSDRAGFVDEARSLLYAVAERMQREDDELHPAVLRLLSAEDAELADSSFR
jgi:uncharacterized protein YozE (UPF0346 family)